MKVSNKTLIIILVCILAAAVAAGAAVYFWNASKADSGGAQVRVTVNGEEFGTYPLNTDATITIAPEGGSWYNTLVIEDGSAAITESNCDNQICVQTTAITENSIIGLIVCLPHGVVVELVEASDS